MVTLLSICSVIYVILNIASAQSPCKTPDNFNGNCIALQQCRPLYKLVRRNLTTEQRTTLRNSQCGRDGRNVLVCCPNTFTIDDLPSSQFCGKQAGHKIAGGTETSIYEFPWMALIHYTRDRNNKTSEGFKCAGTLIHENYVITTASCVIGPLTTRSGYVTDFVRLGEHDLQSNPDCQQQNKCADPVEDVSIAETIVHESYIPTSKSQENDIALIRLKRPVPYTDFIRPICLPVGKLQNRNYEGYPMVVAGFGRTETHDDEGFTISGDSAVKLKLEVNGFNFTECAKNYNASGVNLTNVKQLCANGEGGSGPCNGDGGAPLVAEEAADEYSYLVGIDSFGARRCGVAEYPDIYTRIDQYIDWILDHMKK